MGIIETIKLQGCPVFSGVDSALDGCAVVNFIYGSNGSGKSTISNYLQDPQLPFYSSCSITWNGPESDVLVYNKEWREINFRSRDDLPGVFTLGSDTIEAREKIQGLQERLKASKDKLNNAEEHKQSKEKDLANENAEFLDIAWKDVLKPNEDVFAAALVGFRNSKGKFSEGLLKDLTSESSITRDELVAKVQSVFDDDPVMLEEIDASELSRIVSELQVIESHAIWEKVIAGNKDINISGLIEELNNSDWVNQGRAYIEDSDACPFCQKRTIDADFRMQLELYFDAQYEKDISEVASKKQEYESKSNLLFQRMNEISEDEKYSIVLESIKQDLTRVIAEFEQAFSKIFNQMKLKTDEPGRVIRIDEHENGRELLDIVTKLNNSIREHNEMISNLNEEKKAVSQAVWALLINENIATIKAHKKKVKELELAIDGLSQTINDQHEVIRQLSEEIIDARKSITSIQPTIDEINRSLRAYGFDGFSIQSSSDGENCYQIIRPDGSPATKTLSEGEETFIAFLYFMQLVRGTTDPNSYSTEKVLVIDDPICSLDSTILYIVSCLIKSLIREAKDDSGGVKQVFILTHNAFFHKEASFNRGQSFCDNKTKYWMIRKYGSESKISCYEHNNPIKTSYELLWDEVRDNAATVISLQNAMRRIIDNYFGMLGSRRTDAIEEQFDTIEEQMICKSLFAWMNDGSHSIPDDLYIDSYSESPDKYREVFKAVFEKTGNAEHYNMMIGKSSILSN